MVNTLNDDESFESFESSIIQIIALRLDIPVEFLIQPVPIKYSASKTAIIFLEGERV